MTSKMAERRTRRGSILMETVLVLPLLFLLIFVIIQFAHIWIAKQMTAYAAYCATRAIMVVPPSEQQNAAENAAKVALAWICIADDGQEGVFVPGWGKVNGSGSVSERLEVFIQNNGLQDSDPNASVEVRFKFPLIIPGMMVNKIIANFAADGQFSGRADIVSDLHRSAGNPGEIAGWPYLRLTEACTLPMPYSTKDFPANGFARSGEGGL